MAQVVADAGKVVADVGEGVPERTKVVANVGKIVADGDPSRG